MKKYGIKITYSWGDEEAFIPCDTKEETWKKMKEMAVNEAETCSADHESCPISLRFMTEKMEIVLCYTYDDSYCLYKAVEIKEKEITGNQNYIIRERNVDGCGGIAEVQVHFPDGLTDAEEKILETCIAEASVRVPKEDPDYFDTESIVNSALDEFRKKTRKNWEDGSVSILEFEL